MIAQHEMGEPIENFIQALTSQLDRVQATMRMKARAGLPLTFAVKDISLDLRAHVDLVRDVVYVRPLAPGESESSVVHLTLTTISRPTIEENTIALEAHANEPPLREVVGSVLTEQQRRRLEWLGVQTPSQLQALHLEAGDNPIERLTDIPASRLRMALERSAQPFITGVIHEPDPAGAGPGVVRIVGANLVHTGEPQVQINGSPGQVVDAAPHQLIVVPPAVDVMRNVEVQTRPGMAAVHDLVSGVRQAALGGAPAEGTIT